MCEVATPAIMSGVMMMTMIMIDDDNDDNDDGGDNNDDPIDGEGMKTGRYGWIAIQQQQQEEPVLRRHPGQDSLCWHYY
jgi:hypothetical protein